MDALFDEFQTRAKAVSAEVHRVARKDDALDFIAGFLRDHAGENPNAAVWAGGPFLTPADRERLAAVGISEVEWAIAATGTLAGDFAPVDRRLASTLPPIHIALVRTGSIQPDMPAVLARIHPAHSGYISMITGPSRTADIERVLTIGVHGPKG